jgi:O-antigen ligase
MAKKQRLNRRPGPAELSVGAKQQPRSGGTAVLRRRSKKEAASALTSVGAARTWASQLFDPMNVGVALLAGAVVYLAYHPSDSVAVEQGDALWFTLLAVFTATVTWAGWFWQRAGRSVSGGKQREKVDDGLESSGTTLANSVSDSPRHLMDPWSAVVLDWAAWLLAAWMICAAYATCPPGNLRMATNEAWLWVSGAAIFSSARLLTEKLGTRRSLLALVLVCTVGLSVHALHQYFVTLPANRLLFLQDPDKVLAIAGVNAPAGSSERMVFANRLMDGGPTATFALANSLAAILLFAVVLAVGVLRYRIRVLGRLGIVFWISVVLLCAGALLAARSRSATLAMVISVGLLWLSSGRLGRFRSRTVMVGLGLLFSVSVGGALFLGFFGNREWFEQAPASLAFRFQYWRASWQMALEYPWFGVGPGNFQSLYERFRELSTTEQIAEPHNLFIETLASGGFVALGLLASLLIAIAVVCVHQMRGAGEENTEMETTASLDSNGDKWIFVGGTLAFLLVWWMGLLALTLPDLAASMLVVPAVVLAAFACWPAMRSLGSREIDSIVLSACVGVGIHLMVAGGWTVPGVALLLWIGGGLLTRRAGTCSALNGSKGSSAEDSSRLFGAACGKPCAVAVAIVGALSGLVLTLQSLGPVETRKKAMAEAAELLQSGRIRQAQDQLLVAASADPWSPEAMLWLANLNQLQLAKLDPLQLSRPGASDDLRQAWDSALNEALKRAGEDPAAYRQVASQRIHLYQVHGQAVDLRAATEIFEQVALWSPADEWIMAQMSVLEAARGRSSEAAEYAQKARELSVLGGNIERALSRQLIFLPQKVGRPAQAEPIRLPADELFTQQPKALGAVPK